MPFAESELVLNKDGSVYHLNLHPGEVAKTIIIVGDPGRVRKVSRRFDTIELEKQNREYLTHTGTLNGKRISVISTGMGPDNIEIFLNELDALFNIDLQTREIRDEKVSLDIVRIGTCGGIHPSAIGDQWVVSSKAIGLDNLMQYYGIEHTEEQQSLLDAFYAHTNWPSTQIPLYTADGSESLINKLSDNCITGITATAPGFYAPQGRQLRGTTVIPSIEEQLSTFEFDGAPLLNFEMETSALYGLGTMLGHNCCTVCTVIANRFAKSFSADYKQSVERLIDHTISRLT